MVRRYDELANTPTLAAAEYCTRRLQYAIITGYATHYATQPLAVRLPSAINAGHWRTLLLPLRCAMPRAQLMLIITVITDTDTAAATLMAAGWLSSRHCSRWLRWLAAGWCQYRRWSAGAPPLATPPRRCRWLAAAGAAGAGYHAGAGNGMTAAAAGWRCRWLRWQQQVSRLRCWLANNAAGGWLLAGYAGRRRRYCGGL